MKTERLVGVEWLRGVAAFGIVGCHLVLPHLTPGARWLQSFTDLNVGIFAMLSGLFFVPSCQKIELWCAYAKQRTTRILPPYLIWSFAYIIIDLMMDLITHKATFSFQPYSLHYWFAVIFRGDAAAHLWFLVCLFYAQLLSFVGVKFLLNASKRIYPSFLCLVFGLVLVAFCGQFGNWYRYYLMRLIGFFWLGIGFSLLLPTIQRVPIVVWGLLIGLGAMIIGCGYVHSKFGECVLSVPLVLFAMTWRPLDERVCQIGVWLGRTSFSVYLTHLFFTIGFREIIVRLWQPQSVGIFFLDQVLSWGISLCLATLGLYLSRRISFFKYIFP